MNNTIDNLLHKIEGAYADNTIRAYRRNLSNFQAYCQQTISLFYRQLRIPWSVLLNTSYNKTSVHITFVGT